MAETIVIIEDDESIREMLRYYFHSVGYEVASFESGEEYFEKGGERKPSLFILDIMLPGMDGLEILRRIRTDARLKDTPVLMLTARTSEMDKVKGLETGADDYVVKPFGIMELQARVKALLRRTSRSAAETGGYTRTAEETRLSAILSQIEGAGTVNAVITTEDGAPVAAVVFFDGEDGILTRLRLTQAAAAALNIAENRVLVCPAGK